MNPFRCSNCNKLLGMIEGKAEIKCPKCKTMNKLGLWEPITGVDPMSEDKLFNQGIIKK